MKTKNEELKQALDLLSKIGNTENLDMTVMIYNKTHFKFSVFEPLDNYDYKKYIINDVMYKFDIHRDRAYMKLFYNKEGKDSGIIKIKIDEIFKILENNLKIISCVRFFGVEICSAQCYPGFNKFGGVR